MIRFILGLGAFVLGGLGGTLFNGFFLADEIATVDGRTVLFSTLIRARPDPGVLAEAARHLDTVYVIGGQPIILPGFHWGLSVPVGCGLILVTVFWLVSRRHRSGPLPNAAATATK